MNTTGNTWKPGDVANGHILSTDNVWVTVGPQLRPVLPWWKRSSTIGITLLAVFFVAAIVVGIAGSPDAPASDSDSRPSAQTAQTVAEIAWTGLGAEGRQNICDLYETSPAMATTLVREKIDPEFVDAVLQIMSQDC